MRLLILSMLFLAPKVLADPTVFDVRKPISLSDKEVMQKDFYINAGSEAGLQKGMIVTVVRKIPLYDSYQSRSAGDLNVPVAKIKIIQVQSGLSVARFNGEIPRGDIPVLEENFIMVGDRLDLATATHEKKSAENDGDGVNPAPAAAPAPEAPTPEKKPVPITQAEPPIPPAQITSQKIEAVASPKDQSPGLAPTQGPTIQ